MKKLFLMILFAVSFTGFLFSLDITFNPPVFGGNRADELNSEIKKFFDDYEVDIENALSGIDKFQGNIIKGFANASVFSSAGATTRTYYGYRNFAASFGAMGAVQFPKNPFALYRDLTSLADSLDGEMNDINDFLDELGIHGNARIGVDIQPLNAQFGLNTSKFLLEDLYLGLKFGYMKLNTSDISFGNYSVGVLGNYQIIKQKRFAKGLFVWRGLNAGTGIIYQNTNLGFNYSLDSETTDMDLSGYDVTASIETQLELDWKTTSFTIPLELMTSVRLLGFLNIPLGLGADIGFGNSNMSIGGSSDIRFFGLPSDLYEITPANVSIMLNGKTRSNIFHPKLMTGLGLNIGPVFIDIPVTIYFTGNGFNAGLSIGFVL